jgi:heptosyltransferase-1
VDAWLPVPTQMWKERPFALSTREDIRAMRRELRGWEFDLCVDMQGSIKSAVVGRMAGAEDFVGAAEPRERQAAWLYDRRVPVHGEHVIEQGCALLGAAVGDVLRPAKVTLPVDAAAERWCDGLMAEIGEKFVMVAPTAGWGAKQWPAERFGAVAAKLEQAGFRTVVNAPSFGDAVGLQVVEASDGAARLVPCSLGQMVALVRRAALVIAGDTGPLHLAAALERPVVGLYGPTDPARNGPYGTRSRVLRHESSRRDHKRLAVTEAGLLQITVDEVVEAALGLLQGDSDDGQDKVIK